MGSQLAADMAELGLWPSPEAAVTDVVGLTPLGRLGEVADMADAVVFLASDGARFITGAGLPVDGGMGMGRPHASPATPLTPDLPKGRPSMSNDKPVIVYGASGYTGRLV